MGSVTSAHVAASSAATCADVADFAPPRVMFTPGRHVKPARVVTNGRRGAPRVRSRSRRRSPSRRSTTVCVRRRVARGGRSIAAAHIHLPWSRRGSPRPRRRRHRRRRRSTPSDRHARRDSTNNDGGGAAARNARAKQLQRSRRMWSRTTRVTRCRAASRRASAASRSRTGGARSTSSRPAVRDR